MPRDYSLKTKEQQQAHTNQMMAKFINATAEIIQESGIEGVTIREVSKRVGFTSAVLYTYFYDLDDLLTYTGFKFRQPYLDDLKKTIRPDMNAYELYYCTERLHNHHAFRNPEIFLNFHFGKHKYSIEKTFQDYYNNIFPEELKNQESRILNMLQSTNILNCDIYLCEELAKEGFIKKENIHTTAEIMVRLQESFFHTCLVDKSIDLDDLEERAMFLFEKVIEMS